MPAKIALLSDIHGNYAALQAVLADVEAAGCAEILVLGDIINGADPSGCVDQLRFRTDTTCLLGNAELYLLTPDLQMLAQYPGAIDYAELMRLLDWFRAQLSNEQLAWLAGLPVELRRGPAYLVHDSPLDRLDVAAQPIPNGLPSHYREICFHGPGLRANDPAVVWERLSAWMESSGVSQVCCGHTHEAFIHRIAGDRLVCNTGSVGMPLDGDPRAAWVLWEPDQSVTQTFTIRRVSYDIDRATAAIAEAHGFEHPDRLKALQQTLRTGRYHRQTG